MDGLPDDLARYATRSLGARDLVRLGASCRAFRDATSRRAAEARDRLASKRRLWDEAGEPRLTIPGGRTPRDLFPTISVAEWSASMCSVRRVRSLFWTPDHAMHDPRHLRLEVDGPRGDTDEVVRKLLEWVPERCAGLVGLYVSVWPGGDRRESFADEHLAAFRNARNVNLYECDGVTDEGLARFAEMDWLHVWHCAGVSGACTERLVTEGALRYISVVYDDRTAPALLAPEPAPALRGLKRTGALRIDAHREVRT